MKVPMKTDWLTDRVEIEGKQRESEACTGC